MTKRKLFDSIIYAGTMAKFDFNDKPYYYYYYFRNYNCDPLMLSSGCFFFRPKKLFKC